MAPTLVATYPSTTTFDTSTATKDVSVTTAAGDLLVIMAISEDNAYSMSTPTGGSLTYTLRQDVSVASYTRVTCWTAPATGSATFNVSITRATADAARWGYIVYRYSNHGGVGQSAKTNVSSGAPSLSITTTGANSALVVGNGDWAAADGTSRTWRSVNVSATETLYYRNTASYTVYQAHHTDTGAAGAKTAGLSAPSGQKYSIVALEVLAAGGTSASASDAATTVDAPAPGVSIANVPPEAALVVDAPAPVAGVGGLPAESGVTVAALDASVTVSDAGSPDEAGVTVAALDATVTTTGATNAPADPATTTLTAETPVARVSVAPPDAALSVAALAGVPQVSPAGDTGVLTVAALDATVSTAGNTSAPATESTLSVAGLDATVTTTGSTSANAATSAVTVDALAPGPAVFAFAGTATVAVAAFDPGRWVATVSGTAELSYAAFNIVTEQPSGSMSGVDRAGPDMTDAGRAGPGMSGMNRGSSTMGGA